MDFEELVSHPELPSIPEAILKLNELINNNRPIEELAIVIHNEPSLTARTLELANSAWYKRQREITTVHDAIAIIGIVALHQLIFASSVIRTFAGLNSELVDMNKHWHQSVRTATAAQTLAHQTKINDPIELFTAGLLVYIGQLVLYIATPEKTRQILTLAQTRQQPQFKIENELLGYNHSQVTTALLKRWNVPANIFSAISTYTDPENAEEKYRSRACILNVAHYMQHVHNMDFNTTDPTEKVSDFALKKLQINIMDLDNYSPTAASLYNEAVTMLGL
ncbi:MAG: HDOD domain-containing protein [Gammaproteobacteria bacterium]|nr:HDOD domain-containing protein [Gammaproteobacteria bacterium]